MILRFATACACLLMAGCREKSPAPVKATSEQIQKQNQLMLDAFMRVSAEFIAISAARHELPLEVASDIVREVHLGFPLSMNDWPKPLEVTDKLLLALAEKHALPKAKVADICWDVWVIRSASVRP